MREGFYRAFEERHRGSRALIKERLRAYLPFLEPLRARAAGLPTIDLGCGRGEWVELLGEFGFRSHGVDLDAAMLEGCQQAGLSVEQADAIAFIRGLPDQSQAVVSAFHLVEHLAFAQVQEIVEQALRVLIPGGLLVLETPNPENIVVGTCNFYLDPTHERPLPPALLAFLPEYAGFARVKTVRLQAPEGVLGESGLALFDVLGSASPDYAVVAVSTAPAEVLESLLPAFEANYGIDTATLAQRYQAQQDARLIEVARHAATAADHANRIAENLREGFDAAQARDAQVRVAIDQAITALSQQLSADLGRETRRLTRELQATQERARIALEAAESSEAHYQLLRHEWMAFRGRPARPWYAFRMVRAPSQPNSSLLAGITSSLVEGNPRARLALVNMARRLRLHEPMRRAYWWLTGFRPGAAAQAGIETTAREMPVLTPRAREIFRRFKVMSDKKRKS